MAREDGKEWRRGAGGDSPGSRAVLEEDIEVFGGEEFAAVDARLDGSQAAQDANLFHVANDGNDVESLRGSRRQAREARGAAGRTLSLV